MRATPGMPALITTLADRGWDVAILTDANTVFVNHWIKTHELQVLKINNKNIPSSIYKNILSDLCISKSAVSVGPSVALQQQVES